MSAADETPVVTRNDEESRYEIHLGDLLAGFTEFDERRPGWFVFPHTEIDPAFGGRGLGTVLVAGAVADVAQRGETIVPVCPFVAKYLKTTDVPGLEIAWDGANA